MNVCRRLRNQVVHELRRRDEQEDEEDEHDAARAEDLESPPGAEIGAHEDDGEEDRDQDELRGPREPDRAECERNEVRGEADHRRRDDQERGRANRLPRLPAEAVHEEGDVQQSATDSHTPGEEAGPQGRRVHRKLPRWGHLGVVVPVHVPRIPDPVPAHVRAEDHEDGREERPERPLVDEDVERENRPHDRADERARDGGPAEAEIHEPLPVVVDYGGGGGPDRKREGNRDRRGAPGDPCGEENRDEEEPAPQAQVRIDERDRAPEDDLEKERGGVHARADSGRSDQDSRTTLLSTAGDSTGRWSSWSASGSSP